MQNYTEPFNGEINQQTAWGGGSFVKVKPIRFALIIQFLGEQTANKRNVKMFLGRSSERLRD